MKLAISALAAATLLFSAPAALAATVSTSATDLAEFVSNETIVRFRAQNSGSELFVGKGDFGVGANRTEAGITWGASQSFAAEYNFASGILTGTVGAISRTFNVGADQDFNAFRIDVRGPRSDNFFRLADVSVNGSAIGDFAGNEAGSNTITSFLVKEFAHLPAISISGFVEYFGTPGNFGGAETGRVEFKFGSVPVNAIPLPAAGWLLLSGLAGLGFMSRRRKAAAA